MRCPIGSIVAAGIFMYTGFAMGAGPNDGWFNYVPYANKEYNPGLNMDFYALGMIFLGISTTVGSVNFVVTFLRLRAPGMSINRVPIMIWGTLTASAANILVVPSVSLAFFLLWMDRNFGTHFFDVSAGGQPLLWQHLFWIFAPSLGLRHRAAGDGHGLRCPAGFLPSSARRLYRRRSLDARDHDARLRRLGASYVHDRAAEPRAFVLQRRFDHHRHSKRRRCLRLDIDDLARSSGHHHGVPLFR